MLKFNLTAHDPKNIKRQFESLPMRLEYLKKAIGNSIASSVQQDIVKRIPAGTGWLSIYKSAIKANYDGKSEWVVSGEKEVSITAVDANTTLLEFTGSDKASAVLVKYNPWPVDMVPAINAIYSSKIIMKPASQGEIDQRRAKIKNYAATIKLAMSVAGFTILPNELPKFGSNTIADLSYLAKRLENGLGGYPRVPHWRPAADNISATIKSTLKSTGNKFESILRGNVGKTPPTLTSKLRSMLASAVRRSPSG